MFEQSWDPPSYVLNCVRCNQTFVMDMMLAESICNGDVTITTHALMEPCTANN